MDHLVGLCANITNVRPLGSHDLGSMGADPVFSTKSKLFDSGLKLEDWYDTRAAAGQVNPNSNLPYGFEHVLLRGRPKGYPVVIQSHVHEWRMRVRS